MLFYKIINVTAKYRNSNSYQDISSFIYQISVIQISPSPNCSYMSTVKKYMPPVICRL